MTFLDDIFKSIKAELYDRAVSPLMGSFVVSWAIWNYKFLLTIFSDEKLIEKFRIIDQEIYTDWTLLTEPINIEWPVRWAFSNPILIPELITNPTLTVILPALSAFAYIYIYPLFAKPVFQHARTKQKEILDIKREIDDDTLLTEAQSRDVKNLAYEIEASMQKDIDRKDREIERLKNEIEQKETPVNVNIETNLRDYNDLILTEDAKILLKEASEDKNGRILHLKSTQGAHIETNGKVFNEENRRSIAKWENAINELLLEALITEEGQNEEFYIVTHKGYELAGDLSTAHNEPPEDINEKNQITLDDMSIRIMKVIGAGTETENSVLNSFDDKIQAKHLINQLIEKGFVTNPRNGVLKNTAKGIAYLADGKRL